MTTFSGSLEMHVFRCAYYCIWQVTVVRLHAKFRLSASTCWAQQVPSNASYVGTSIQEDIASSWHSKQKVQQSCAMTQTSDRSQDEEESQFPWRCDVECDTTDLHNEEEPDQSELVELLQAEAMYRCAN